MADNGWYEKHRTDVATALKKGKVAPKDQAVSCTVVRAKDGTDLLCAHVSAGKATSQVKEGGAAGTKVVSAGVLYLGDDGLTYELTAGDTGIKGRFEKAAKALGVPMSVTVLPPAKPAAAPPPPAPGTAGQPDPQTAAALAQVRAGLTRLMPVIKQTTEAHPDRKAELLAVLTRCQQALNGNQAAEATKAMQEVARLLQTLGAAAAGAYKEQYDGLLGTLTGDLRRLSASGAAPIQAIVDEAAALAGKGDYQAAFQSLNRAAEALAKAAGAERAAAAAGAIPEGKVAAMKAALSRARTEWDAAMTAARARLKPVQAAIQAEFPEAAKGVQNIVDSYEQELLAELQAGQAKADEAGLAAAVSETLTKVRSLRTEALGDEVFAYLESCGVPVQAAFTEAFDEVEGLLQVG